MSSDDPDFEEYIPSTTDPSPWVLVGTIAICLLSIVLFPLCLALHQRLLRQRSLQETAGAPHPDKKPPVKSKETNIIDTGEATTIEIENAPWTSMKSLHRTVPRRKALAASTLFASAVISRLPWGKRNKEDDDDLDRSNSSGSSGGISRNVSITVDDQYLSLSEQQKNQRRPLDNIDDCVPCAPAPSPAQPGKPSAKHVYTQKYQIDLWSGTRPWFVYYMSMGFVRKIQKCATWDTEMRKLVALVIPFTFDTGVEQVMELLEVITISQLLGTATLSAYYSVEFIVTLSTMFQHGAMSSLTLLCSQAIGARNLRLAGQFVQLGVLQRQVWCFPLVVFWWYFLHDLVLWLGFSEETAAIAQQYVKFAFLSEYLEAISDGLTYILEVAGYERYSAMLNSAHSVVRLVGVFSISFFYPDAELWIIGLFHAVCTAIFLLVNVLTILYRGWIADFWRGFLYSFAPGNIPVLSTFCKSSVPMAFGHATEYCEWELLFVFAAVAGPAEVAVWGLIGSVWEVAENIGLSIADAAEVRVGQLLGSNRPQLARYCSHKSLFLGFVASIFMASLVLGLSPFLPLWLTKDTTLQAMLKELFPLVCVGLAALTFGAMSWTILCAQGRVMMSTTSTFLGTLLVTLPLALLSTFALNWNLQGLLAAVVIGYSFSGLVNSFLMITSDWEMIARQVCRQNNASKKNKKGETNSKSPLTSEIETDDDSIDVGYDDYDWDELPDNVRQAAGTLGYTDRMWDSDQEGDALDVFWTELTKEQRRAAETLGYTKAVWDMSD